MRESNTDIPTVGRRGVVLYDASASQAGLQRFQQGIRARSADAKLSRAVDTGMARLR